MRIGADASHLRWRRSGIGRYLDGLLHAMAGELSGSDDELFVYYNSRRGAPLFDTGVRERFVRVPKATPWNQVGVPLALRRDGADVYLGGAHVIPRWTRVPCVVVIHDCLAYRDPATKSRSWGIYLRYWTRVSAHRATRVIADSRWTASECERFLGIPASSVDIVPAAVEPTFRPATDAERAALTPELASLRVPARFVLQVGGNELHKGGPLAADAVGELRRRGHDVTLVRCGIPGPDAGRAGVLDVGYVDETTLHSLYRGASAVCVASTSEGFGFPVLEAMASGTPVATVRAAALPEVGGDAVVYAEPGDPARLADALGRILDDAAEAHRLRTAGLQRAAQYTWDRTAHAVLDILREAAAARPVRGRAP